MESKGASLFDLDRTLIKDNSSYRYGSYLYNHNKFPFSSMLYFVGCYGMHKAGGLSLKKLHEKIFLKLFKNCPFEEFNNMACAFFDDNFDSIVYAPARQKLNEAKQMGQATAILSSSPDFLVKLFAERFGVDEWIATKYEINSSNKFSALSGILDGEAKVRFMQSFSLRRGIPLEQITAYSDSYLDFPFLKAAGRAVGVNPDKNLHALCNQYCWEII